MNRHDNLLDRQRQLLGMNGLLGVGASFMLGQVIGNAEICRHDADHERAPAGRVRSNTADRKLRVVA